MVILWYENSQCAGRNSDIYVQTLYISSLIAEKKIIAKRQSCGIFHGEYVKLKYNRTRLEACWCRYNVEKNLLVPGLFQAVSWGGHRWITVCFRGKMYKSTLKAYVRDVVVCRIHKKNIEKKGCYLSEQFLVLIWFLLPWPWFHHIRNQRYSFMMHNTQWN